MEKLSLFFAKIKELSFWQRLFSWASIRSLSYDAYEEFKSLSQNLNTQKNSYDQLKHEFTQVKTQKDNLSDQVRDLEKREERNELKIKELNETIADLNNRVSTFESLKEQREQEHTKKIAQLNQAIESYEGDKRRLADERVREKEEHFQLMKTQWTEHETTVKQTIKIICQRYLIDYVDKVPFKGSPDNTIKICNEYIIFDAKSPANEDLSNFPKYVKTQTENVKKYTNQENIRKDIFLVVPSNTIHTITQLFYKMGDYNVFVIAKDSLEPVIISLKKIEEYEFVEQLSPEERDNVCRIIGKFAHTTKRKIQIDQFFATQFIELLVKCKNDLPDEILREVIEFEKAEKLNPPSEKRAKQILTNDLIEKNNSINAEAKIREIDIPSSFEDIKRLE